MKMLWESHKDFQELISLIGNNTCEITVKPLNEEKIRTHRQNKAYWKGCGIAAARLIDGGWTRNKMFSIRQIELPWTPEAFHEDITKPFMGLVYDKDSSTKLTTSEMSQTWSKCRDQIILNTTNSGLGGTVDIGSFPSLRVP